MPQVEEKREGIEERLAKIEGYQFGLSKRVDDLKDSVNQRFDDMNRRFDDMGKRFSLLTWTITGWFTLLTVLVVVFKFVK
ncbi:MAG: hypothetical protein U9R03_01175 [Candidatus Aerophobetes bacterium]|nr:hypothetical protein [Candidatus Aerophobetes bacterium]